MIAAARRPAIGDGIWLILPVKELDLAKDRLSSVLAPHDRRLVMHRLVERTFEVATVAAARERALARVLVVTSDPDVERMALARDFALLPDPGADHSAAAAAGSRHAEAGGARAVVMVASDLPLLAPGDIRGLVTHLVQGSALIAADRSGRGTNAIAVAPPHFRFSFGPDSLARHVAEAQRRGLATKVTRDVGLAADLDTPEDLEWLAGLLFARARATS